MNFYILKLYIKYKFIIGKYIISESNKKKFKKNNLINLNAS